MASVRRWLGIVHTAFLTNAGNRRRSFDDEYTIGKATFATLHFLVVLALHTPLNQLQLEYGWIRERDLAHSAFSGPAYFSSWVDILEKYLGLVNGPRFMRSQDKKDFVKQAVTEVLDVYLTAGSSVVPARDWNDACNPVMKPLLRAYILEHNPPFNSLPDDLWCAINDVTTKNAN